MPYVHLQSSICDGCFVKVKYVYNLQSSMNYICKEIQSGKNINYVKKLSNSLIF